eukprot:249521-Hanusia_phi.AAC.3
MATMNMPMHHPSMMMQRGGEQTNRTVFVGNIPYTASEDQLQEVFETAGPVLAFRSLPVCCVCCDSKGFECRLVLHPETGAPKGFGFCEFRDVESAEIAVRNLNNYEMNGRPLRVDFASSISDQNTAGPSLAQLAGKGSLCGIICTGRCYANPTTEDGRDVSRWKERWGDESNKQHDCKSNVL